MICVVSAGAHTPVGHTWPASAAAVRAGLDHFGEHPEATSASGDPAVVARASWLSDDLAGADRLVVLARRAAREALRRAGLPRGEALRIRALVALPEERPGRPPGLDEEVAEKLGRALRRWGPPDAERGLAVETIAAGHAGGLLALARACEALDAGRADLCLVGGVDSYLDVDTLAWLDETRQLRTRRQRFGFLPGEAAGFCVLAAPAVVARRKLPVIGRVARVATAEEPARIRTDAVCTGAGLTEALRGALAALPGEARAQQMICDLNGEPYRTDELGFALVRVARSLERPGAFLAPADAWGDVGAASGPLFVGLWAAAAARGYSLGPHTVIWGSSVGGLRAAALLRDEPRGGESPAG